MAIYTVDEIQNRIASFIDQSASAPTDTTDEYAWRLKLMNRAYEEWSTAYEWEVLRKEKFLTITGVSQASLALPGDFQKMAMRPVNYSFGVANGQEWPEIRPEDRMQYRDSSDNSNQFFYLLGYKGNHHMIWNPGTLASGASVLIGYFSYPTSLASPADVTLVPEPEFLVERTISHILEVRSDPRYQQYEAKAREILLQMIDNEKNKGLSLNDFVQTNEQKYYGFRIGRD